MLVCDNQLVAMYVSGDLDELETAPVEAHLTDCPACRALARELQADTLYLQEVVHSMQRPEQHARPSHARRWMPAAAAAVLTALVVGFAAGPAVADTVRNVLRWITVREMTTTEMNEYLSDLTQRDASGEMESIPVEPVAVTVSPEEAEAAAGFPLLNPTYLPDGYRLSMIYVWPVMPDMVKRSVGQLYENGKHRLSITHAPLSDTPGQVTAPAGYVEEVRVGDGSGLFVRGALWRGADGPWTWMEGPISLSFERNGQSVRISASEKDLSLAELIKIAESIPN